MAGPVIRYPSYQRLRGEVSGGIEPLRRKVRQASRYQPQRREDRKNSNQKVAGHECPATFWLVHFVMLGVLGVFAVQYLRELWVIGEGYFGLLSPDISPQRHEVHKEG